MKFDLSIVQTRIHSPLGDMLLAATNAGLAGAWFTDQRHRPEALDFKNVPHAWPVQDSHPTLREAARQLAEFFSGKRKTFELRLDINGGTLFQQSVWRALLKIPYGQTTSYGSISRQIGNPTALRAVGSAVGRNPLSLVVPCHRVLGGDGSLTGYAGGLHRKTALLELEGVGLQAGPGLLANSRAPSLAPSF
jgi:methylated-DNA-[protein]-cysteine S-methyltransferase